MIVAELGVLKMWSPCPRPAAINNRGPVMVAALPTPVARSQVETLLVVFPLERKLRLTVTLLPEIPFTVEVAIELLRFGSEPSEQGGSQSSIKSPYLHVSPRFTPGRYGLGDAAPT